MSKGLDLIKRQEAELIDGYPTGNVYIGLAQEELNELEKELKALEVIIKKQVNIHSWYYNECNKIPYEIYKQSIMAKNISSELLTQEEYDLLKEVGL